MHSVFNYLWYQPQQKDKVLEYLHIPSLEERTRRGIFGLVWGPAQPWPINLETQERYEGEQGAEWAWVFGNFLGYELDPCSATGRIANGKAEYGCCEMQQIEEGLVGGTIRQEWFGSQRYIGRKRTQERLERENGAKAHKDRVEERNALRRNAIERLLIVTALRCGIKKPEKQSLARLQDVYDTVLLTDEFEVPTIEQWEAIQVPAEVEPETLENTPDWEDRMRRGWAAAGCQTIRIVKPYKIEKVA